MTKSFILLFCFAAINYSCNDYGSSNNDEKAPTVAVDTTPTNKLAGRWEMSLKGGIAVIEVKDSSDVILYNLNSRNQSSDTLHATMGIFDERTMWIHVPTARFDYRIEGDTLIEFDKVGTQGKYIKVKK